MATRSLLALALLLGALSPVDALAARARLPASKRGLSTRSAVPMMAEAEAEEAPLVPTLNKSDLVSRIATRTGVTKKVANDLLSATMETVIEAVCEGNKVMLVGFGSFAPKHLPAREGRNPRTGEKLQIQASRVPAFTVAKTFKERVNASKD